MVELIVKLLIAAAMVAFSALSGSPALDPTWKIAAFYAALAVFAWRLEERGLRNPGFAGLISGGESMLVALAVASAGQLDNLGFLVLAPLVEATTRFGSDPSYLAPISAAALVAAGPILGGKMEFGLPLLAQAGGVLVVGLFVGKPSESNGAGGKIIPRENAELIRNFSPLSLVRNTDLPDFEPEDEDPIDDLLVLRERFRQLRDSYLDLEMRSKKDRISATLAEIRPLSVGIAYTKIVEKIASMCGAQGVILYTLAGYDTSMVVRAVHGEFSDPIQMETIEVDTRIAPAFIKVQAEKAYKAHAGGINDATNVLLTHDGRLYGMMTLRHDSPNALEQARLAAEEAGAAIADWVYEVEQREAHTRRLREAELMYELATLISGEHSHLELATRLVRELKDVINADCVQLHLIDDDAVTTLARSGNEMTVMDRVRFELGEGWEGWSRSGFPDLVLHDTRTDVRFLTSAASRNPVGSFIAIPIWGIEVPQAVLTAATKRAGILDRGAVETLRVAASEIGRRLFPGASGDTWVGPREFQGRLQAADGSIAVLEVLRREAVEKDFGRIGWIHVLRRWGKIIRTQLPPSGVLCRHEDGSFLVHLPGFTRDESEKWVNQVVSLATSTEIRTPDGSTRILSGIRGRVAELGPQENRIIDKLEA